jgi:hypothetical protein
VRSLPQAGQRGRFGGAGAERTGPKPDAPARQIKYLMYKKWYRDRVCVVRTLRQRPGGNQVKANERSSADFRQPGSD